MDTAGCPSNASANRCAFRRGRLHAQAEGPHAAQQQPALERAEHRAAVRALATAPLPQIVVARRDQHARQDVRVPVELLGRRVHHQVRAMLDRAAEHRRRDGVVDHEAGARVVRGGGGGGQVGDRPARVGGRLRPDDLRGGRPERRAQRGHVAVRNQIQGDPPARRQVLEPAANHPVHLLRGDDVIPDVERLEHRGGRRHAGAEQHRRPSPFERREQRLDRFVGRVLVARVDAPAGGSALGRPLVLDRRMNGGHDGAGRRIAPAEYLRGARRHLLVWWETRHAGTPGNGDYA